MIRGFALAAAILIGCGAARAAEPAEKLLPASTQLYLRWDGIQAHQATYDQSARGKMYAGDTGKMARELGKFLLDRLRDAALANKLGKAAPPEELERINADLRKAAGVAELLAEHGLILAGEIRLPADAGLDSFLWKATAAVRNRDASRLVIPDFRAALIVPDAGGKAESLFAGLRLIAGQAKFKLGESDKFKRKVTTASSSEVPISVSWWLEGDHAVVCATTGPIESVLKQMQAGGEGLTAATRFRKLKQFREFETVTRGFLDGEAVMAALAKFLRPSDPKTWTVLETIGLAGLKGASFQFGFEGPISRSMVELEFDQKPVGLAAAFGSRPLKLGDMPPLPADATRWSALRVDYSAAYDTILSLFALADAQVETKGKRGISESLRSRRDETERELNRTLGVKLRTDLIAALGDTFVTYSSPGENFATAIGTGQVILASVKDEAKVRATMKQLTKALSAAVSGKMRLRARKYHGVEINEIYFQEGGVVIPSYTIHNGWLALSLYPQSIQGYVLRSQAKLPMWSPDAQTRAKFAKLPVDAIGMQYSDPIATMKQLLTIAPPLLASAFNSEPLDAIFEAGLIPNAHEATQHLFPNVTWLRRSARSFQIDSYDSFSLPFESLGPDLLMPYFGLFAARFVF